MPKKHKPSLRERARRARQSARTRPNEYVRPVDLQGTVQEAPPDAQPLTAAAYRKVAGFRFQLPSLPGQYVVIRRTNLFALFMADAVPMHLLEMAGELGRMQQQIASNPNLLATMDKITKQKLTDAINRVIEVAVASPRITLDPKLAKADSAVLHVDEIDFSDRLAIFIAVQYPPPIGKAEYVPVAPLMAPDDARSFRGNEPRPDGAAVPNGPRVRPEAKQLDVPGVGPVEYISA
jgi:hypothetical protein